MKEQQSQMYQLPSTARAPFSKQTPRASPADRVTQINPTLSAFYRFVFKHRELKTAQFSHPPRPPTSSTMGNCPTLPEQAGVSDKEDPTVASQYQDGSWSFSFIFLMHQEASKVLPQGPAALPPWEHRKVWLVMGPGSAKVLNLLSHSREM